MIQNQINIYWSAFSVLIIKGASAIIKFVLIAFITNSMGAAAYGAYSYVLSFFLLINVLARVGEDVNSQKKSAQLVFYRRYKKLVFRIISVFQTVICSNILLSLISISIVYFLIEDHAKLFHFNLLIPFGFLYSFVWIYSYFFKGIGQVLFSALNLEVIFPIVNILFIFFSLDAGFSKELILSGSYIGALFIVFLIYTLNFWNFLKKNDLNFRDYQREVVSLHESLPFMFVSVSTMLLVWIDTFILGVFVSNEDLGVYSLVVRLGSLIVFPASAMAGLFSNRVVELFEENSKEKLLLEFNKTTKYLFFVCLLLFAIINLFADDILYMFGKEFGLGQHSLLVFSFAQLLIGTTGVFESVFLMTDNKKVFLIINGIMIFLNMSLGFIMISAAGILGAAYSTLISVIVNRTLQYLFLRYRYFHV